MDQEDRLSSEQLAGIVVQRKDIKRLLLNAGQHLEVAKQNLSPIIQALTVGEKGSYTDLAIACAESIEISESLLSDLHNLI